jgi:hypothetical protein
LVISHKTSLSNTMSLSVVGAEVTSVIGER